MAAIPERPTPNNDQLIPKPPSSQDLDFRQNLGILMLLCQQVFGGETEEGQSKVFYESLRHVNLSMLQKAFAEWLSRGSKFPVPSDILKAVESIQARDLKGTFVPVDKRAVEAEQNTPEWKAANLKLRQQLSRLAGKPEPTE